MLRVCSGFLCREISWYTKQLQAVSLWVMTNLNYLGILFNQTSWTCKYKVMSFCDIQKSEQMSFTLIMDCMLL